MNILYSVLLAAVFAAAECEPIPVSVPLFGCKLGSATASVPAVEGATYAWSVEGGVLTGGAGTNRIALTLGTGETVKVSVIVTTAACTRQGSGTISLRPPLAIEKLEVPAEVEADKPVTITWRYVPGATPSSQELTGTAFASPVLLGGTERSYTFTPASNGSKTIELRASYASSVPSPVTGRRRSVARSRNTATECPNARATARMEVRGCSTAPPDMVVVDEIETGGTFEAMVVLDTGEISNWEVENGILDRYFGSTVQVTAGSAGEVRLGVTVTRGENCFAEASRVVPIRQIPVCTDTPAPTATLTKEAQDCDSVTVQATFTGTPPFKGTWSDGTQFTTNATSLTHVFRTAGTYSINMFRDAVCLGDVVNTVSVPQFGATVEVTTAGGNCVKTATLVATFTGVPPFSGRWGDDERFTTNEFTIQKTPTRDGYWWIDQFTDSTCREQIQSNVLRFEPVPVAVLTTEPFCQPGPTSPTYLTVELQNGQPPFTVYWKDGAVTATQYYYAQREILQSEAEKTYEIDRVTTETCEADVPNKIGTVVLRPDPILDESQTDFLLCPGQTGQLTIGNVHPQASYEWILEGGEIVTGQGTSQVTYRRLPNGIDPMKLEVRATYPDGACGRSLYNLILIGGEAIVDDFKIVPSKIKAGERAELQWSIDPYVNHMSFFVDSPDRRDDLHDAGNTVCTSYECAIAFRDTHGPGTVVFTMSYGGHCTNDGRTVTATLTIEP